MGVKVKLTSIDIRMAKAMVNPKLYKNRPTIPLMKATGTNMTTRESVVAITASPISLVAATAASTGG